MNRDLRAIVHRTDSSLLLCYVAHHDQAYEWAERRKLEVHPRTGAAQLVEMRETVQEMFVPKPVDAPALKRSPLAGVPESELLGCGVPAEWIAGLRSADEDALLRIVEHLPAEDSPESSAHEASPFDFAVVDEAQDVSVQQLRFLAALARGRPDALFFSGDRGQRIFRQPFSWKALGVDTPGRSTTLKVVYQTSHQI